MPPPIINGAIEAMKQAVLLGYEVADVIAEGVKYINSKQNQLKEREVILTKGAVNTVGTLFLTANASYLEVLTAQQNALRSELDLLELSRKRWIS